MRMSDLNYKGEVEWIICKTCGGKYLMRGGTRHIKKCVRRKELGLLKKGGKRYDKSIKVPMPRKE